MRPELRALVLPGSVAAVGSLAIGFLLSSALGLEPAPGQAGPWIGWAAGTLTGAASPLVHLGARRIRPTVSPFLSLGWSGIRLLLLIVLCASIAVFAPAQVGVAVLFLLSAFFCWHAVEVRLLLKDG